MSRKKYIDRTDLELLNVLKKHPGYTVAKLGDEIDLSAGPTHTRLINLGEDGEGFFKNTIEIDYTKFGVQEHVFSFKLVEKKDQVDRFDPEDTFRQITETLSRPKESLITSIELLQDVTNQSHWVSVSYYPRYTEKTIRQRDSKKKDKDTPSDKDEIKNLLSQHINKGSKTLQLIKRQEFSPSLDIGHEIRKEPE
jgi:DNA-binding Lrp family transcriptional regulator